MDAKPKIGRNDPCPCGSGRKYKKCCGATQQPTPVRVNKERDYVALNRAIAYKGKIGRIREEFCQNYINRKKSMIKEIEEDLADQTAAMGETIICHKGCFYCCSQYVGASLQESEVIVYYLYQHEEALSNFLKAYPIWRAKVRENEYPFNRVKQTFNEFVASGLTKENKHAYFEATKLYLDQNIPCAFLSNSACSIYEVRPWACAGVVATTPGEWCSPSNDNKPSVYISRLTPKEISFYRETNSLIMLPAPLAVYEILNGGFIWLSDIPGLDGLDDDAMNDPEVSKILKNYL